MYIVRSLRLDKRFLKGFLIGVRFRQRCALFHAPAGPPRLRLRQFLSWGFRWRLRCICWNSHHLGLCVKSLDRLRIHDRPSHRLTFLFVGSPRLYKHGLLQVDQLRLNQRPTVSLSSSTLIMTVNRQLFFLLLLFRIYHHLGSPSRDSWRYTHVRRSGFLA